MSIGVWCIDALFTVLETVLSILEIIGYCVGMVLFSALHGIGMFFGHFDPIRVLRPLHAFFSRASRVVEELLDTDRSIDDYNPKAILCGLIICGLIVCILWSSLAS